MQMAHKFLADITNNNILELLRSRRKFLSFSYYLVHNNKKALLNSWTDSNNCVHVNDKYAEKES